MFLGGYKYVHPVLFRSKGYYIHTYISLKDETTGTGLATVTPTLTNIQ